MNFTQFLFIGAVVGTAAYFALLNKASKGRNPGQVIVQVTPNEPQGLQQWPGFTGFESGGLDQDNPIAVAAAF